MGRSEDQLGRRNSSASLHHDAWAVFEIRNAQRGAFCHVQFFSPLSGFDFLTTTGLDSLHYYSPLSDWTGARPPALGAQY